MGAMLARREGFEPPTARQIRRRMLYVDLVGSRRVWPAHVGSLIGPDGSRRIVWMIKRMIKAHPIEVGWQGEQFSA
jgi:hypothetical protein